MTHPRRPRPSAALVLLVACNPLVYTLDEAGQEHGDDSETTDTTTDPHPTDPGPGPGPSEPQPTPNTCFDGGLNNEETDVDCGGPCPPCATGQMCEHPSDCLSNACAFGQCADLACDIDDDCLGLGKEPCMRGLCDPGGACVAVPAFDGELCDDGDLCTDKSVCAMGKCLGEPRVCEELAGPCRVPFCNPANGKCAVEFEAPGTLCDDGRECSDADMCTEFGECAGQTLPPLFFDNFIMQQGWTLDPMWQIDVAVPAVCDARGAEDPPFDVGGDGSLAGLLIGGCTPPDGFAPTCLTSPFLGLMPEPLELRYWSQLSNAGAPMEASVEVFDGQTWTPLTIIKTVVLEKQWTEHSHPLPMQPILQVRFCQSQMGVGMVSVGGWSLDDVAIGPAACEP
jgi:hypothetical protein